MRNAKCGKRQKANDEYRIFQRQVGWVKRDTGTINFGFAYLNAPQTFENTTKLANPT
jgi:hypothetical protein